MLPIRLSDACLASRRRCVYPPNTLHLWSVCWNVNLQNLTAIQKACAAYRNRNTRNKQWDKCPDCTMVCLHRVMSLARLQTRARLLAGKNRLRSLPRILTFVFVYTPQRDGTLARMSLITTASRRVPTVLRSSRVHGGFRVHGYSLMSGFIELSNLERVKNRGKH